MNLLFSYSVKEDLEAVAKGYKFLGAGHDKNEGEVHVFEMTPLAAHQEGTEAITS